jgi:calcineurin-like phosphoesterase family protein
MDQDLPLHPKQFDVGVDNWNYKPVEVNEFLKIDKK